MSFSYLRSVMVGESKAYGFTIAFWGSGTLLVSLKGMPSLIEALMFGFGAVLGFGILAIFAFKGAMETAKEEEAELLVLSTIHYIAALVPVIISYYIGLTIQNSLAFLLAGMNISIFYNLLMAVERTVAEKALRMERRLEEIITS